MNWRFPSAPLVPHRDSRAPIMHRTPRPKHFALLILGWLAACASPQGPSIPKLAGEINSTLTEEAETVIVPGDTLNLRAMSLTAMQPVQFDVEVVVQPDGKIVLPGAGAQDVAGLTPEQLTTHLEEALSDDLPAGSKVAANITQAAPRTIHVIGAVKHSGQYVLPPDGHMTLVEALAEAGGVGHYTAYLGKTTLVRWDPIHQKQKSWVIDARERWWSAEEAILLQPNDILYIPDTPIVRVNQWIDYFIIRNIPFPRFIIPAP